LKLQFAPEPPGEPKASDVARRAGDFIPVIHVIQHWPSWLTVLEFR
jgi:hypothetical protein